MSEVLFLVIKITEDTLKKIVGRVINEGDWMQGVEKDIEKSVDRTTYRIWTEKS